LIRAAEAHYRAFHNPFSGIESGSRVVDFRAIVNHKRQLVEEMRQKKYINIIEGIPNVRLIEGRAHLAGRNRVTVEGEEITADRIIIATGAAPLVPPIPGLSGAGYLTNETAFELEEQPESLIVLGGRYVALECAQMFSRFGTRVTMLQRSSRILPTEGEDITEPLTGYLREEGIQVVTNVKTEGVRRKGGRVLVEATVDGKPLDFEAREILVATGRRPNTRGLGLEKAGVEVDSRGFLKVDDALRTSVSNIYGAGDVIGEPMFVYTAAYEGALAAENALSEAPRMRDYSVLPWVIFTDPQVAGVGWDEAQARDMGIEPDATTFPLDQVPRSLAARDTRGFIKLIRDRRTDRLIGVRILAPEGSELLMEISVAIKYGMTAKELSSLFHPYLTLSEGIKLAAISFERNVEKLSCCAN